MSKSAPGPRVGTKLWVFDADRRVYQRSPEGRTTSGPIWREHWRPQEIVGETRVSWIVGPAGSKPEDTWLVRKYPKRTIGEQRFLVFTEEELARRCWENENRRRIVQLVERCGLAELEAIAKLVGFKEPAS